MKIMLSAMDRYNVYEGLNKVGSIEEMVLVEEVVLLLKIGLIKREDLACMDLEEYEISEECVRYIRSSFENMGRVKQFRHSWYGTYKKFLIGENK